MNEIKYCHKCNRKCIKFYQTNGNLYECFDYISCKLLVNSKKFLEDGFKKSADELYQYYKLNRYNKIKKPFRKFGEFISIFFIQDKMLDRRNNSNNYIFLFI